MAASARHVGGITAGVRRITRSDALRDRGVAICAITNSVGSTARMPSLAPYFDFTMCTYDFMVPAEEGWDVAFQVARLGKYAPGTPWSTFVARRRAA